MKRLRDILLLSALCLFLICFAYARLGFGTEEEISTETDTDGRRIGDADGNRSRGDCA